MDLSVIMSNRNDLVVYNITLNSVVESMKSLNFECEVVVVDNSDPALHALMPIMCPVGFQRHHNVRTYHQDQPCFTSSRMLAAEKAKGRYIFCVDSHVLFGNRLLQDSYDFMERHKDDIDLGFGHPPIRWAHQGPAGTKHALKISDEGLPNGGWDTAYREESKMFWKFMPWICRRDWYLDTLKGYGTHSDHHMSWGGAEQLQQVKALMLGYTNWAIPTDPLIHIGPYTPDVVKTGQYKYRTYGKNGNFPHGFGILASYVVLMGPEVGYKYAKAGEEKFFNRHKIAVDNYWEKAVEVGLPEFEWLDKRKLYSYEELIKLKPWEDSPNG